MSPQASSSVEAGAAQFEQAGFEQAGFEQAGFEQAGRLLAIDTPLGPDVLVLTDLRGHEAVSRGFVYTIEVMTRASKAEVGRLLGLAVTLWLNNSNAERRPLHGHVRHLTRLAGDIRGYHRWRAEVVPWMWFLTRTIDCRIYQNLTVVDILSSVFEEHRQLRYEMRLLGDYPKLAFCVQYRESTFAFVSRLMEEFGIFYWFEHAPGHHLLVLADSNMAAPFTTPRQMRLATRTDLGEIQTLQHDYDFRSGRWALKDYDFEIPSKDLRTGEQTIIDNELMREFEHYDYPGRYLARDRGNEVTRLRMEAEEALHHTVSGEASWAGFDPGKRFTVSLAAEANDASYLMTEVRHSARCESTLSGSAEPPFYRNSFTAIRADTPYRPERNTPKPVVHGPQTATVVGPAGENIHTDHYGRVRLLFHWDRRGRRNETASCWIRVSQTAAGSHLGGIAIPHVGQEMIVAFEEGDPDRPIVIGRVHNGTNMPPVNLPRDKNKTVIRDHGDNKLIMHGKAGSQWLSCVSPRAVSLVAMRSAAKPLSADVSIDNVSFDSSQDTSGFGQLQSLWGELTGNNQTTMAAPLDPQAGYSVDASGADAAYDCSVNLVSESEINSLSVSNTNAWVGVDMNTWVKNNANNHVCNWQHDYYKYHHELTPLLHIEETPGLHQELTGVHTEETVLHAEITGAHFEFHDGVHFEQEYGAHMKIGNMTEFNSNFQKIQFTSDQTEVIEEVTKIIDQHVEVVQKKLSVVANSLSNYVTKTELTQATHTIQAGVLSLTASKVLFLTGAQGIVMMSMDSIQIM